MMIPWVKRSRLVEQANRAQDLQDRLRRAEALLEVATEARDAAQAEVREATRMVADWLAERQFGVRIYDSNTPALPAAASEAELLDKYEQRKRVQGRDVVRQAEQNFLRELKRRSVLAETAAGATNAD